MANKKLEGTKLRMYVCTVSLKLSLTETGCYEYQGMEQNAMRIPVWAHTHNAMRDVGNCLVQKSPLK